MRKEAQKKIELFNKRVNELYIQVCGWLDEEKIEFVKKEREIRLEQERSGSFQAKCLDVFTTDNERLFSIVPYAIWVVAAEGLVKLSGDSGEESLVYLLKDAYYYKSEKEKILHNLRNGSRDEGWHWLDEQIIGKTPLFTKEIFLVLLERIN